MVEISCSRGPITSARPRAAPPAPWLRSARFPRLAWPGPGV